MIKFKLPQNPVQLFERSVIGYDDNLIGGVIEELKRCPALKQYLQSRAFELAAKLLAEVDISTPREVRENIQMHYSGQIAELRELLMYSQAQLIPNEDKE